MSAAADQQPELQLERVSAGGRRHGWKIALLSVGGVLVGVVAFAAAGRPPATPSVANLSGRPHTESALVEPSPLALASADAATDPPEPSATPWPSRRPVGEPPVETGISTLRWGADAYALIAEIDGRMYMDVLDEYRRGKFRGSFRVPFPVNPSRDYDFEFAQLWTRDRSRQSLVVVDSWTVRLGALQLDTTNEARVIEEVVAARPRQADAPRAVKRGYAIVVRAESRYNFGVIWVDVSFGSAEPQTSLVYRDWPLRQDKDDLAALFKSFIDA